MAFHHDLQAQHELDNALNSLTATDLPLDEAQDRDTISELLSSLTEQYRFISQVNPACEPVERLLEITGMNSWKAFQKRHMDLLLEYMDMHPTDERATPVIQNEPENQFTWRIKRLEKRIKELREQIKDLQEQNQLVHEEREADLNTALTLKKRKLALTKEARFNKAAKSELEEINEQIKELHARKKERDEAPDITQEIVDLSREERSLCAEIKAIEKCSEGIPDSYINTHNVQWNCQRYNSLGNDCAFMYRIETERESKLLEQVANQRYTPSNVEHLSAAESNETESWAQQELRKCRDSMDFIVEQFITFQMGYLINEAIYMANNEGKCPLWKPKEANKPHRWMTLEERVSWAYSKANGYTQLNEDAIFASLY